MRVPYTGASGIFNWQLLDDETFIKHSAVVLSPTIDFFFITELVFHIIMIALCPDIAYTQWKPFIESGFQKHI